MLVHLTQLQAAQGRTPREPASPEATGRTQVPPPPTPPVSDCLPSVQLHGNICSAELEEGDGALYTAYIVQLNTCNGWARWTVRRRYSDFTALQAQLGAAHAAIPPLPPRRVLWGAGIRPDVVAERVAGLNAWLEGALAHWQFHPALLAFVDADSHLDRYWCTESRRLMAKDEKGAARHKPLRDWARGHRPSSHVKPPILELLESSWPNDGSSMARATSPLPAPAAVCVGSPDAASCAMAAGGNAEDDRRSPDSVVGPLSIGVGAARRRVDADSVSCASLVACPSHAHAAHAYAQLAHALLGTHCSMGAVRRFIEHVCAARAGDSRPLFAPPLLVCATRYLERLALHLPLSTAGEGKAAAAGRDAKGAAEDAGAAWQLVVVALLCLAAKSYTDHFESTSYFVHGWGQRVRAGAPCLTLRAVCAAECDALRLLGYRTMVEPAEFARGARANSFVHHQEDVRYAMPRQLIFG